MKTEAEILSILNTYNYWQNPIDKDWLERKQYLESLSLSLGTNLIKVLIGQRRVWKSTLLRQFIATLIHDKHIDAKNILVLNLEYDDFSFIQNKDDLKNVLNIYRTHLKPQWKTYLFIDEIQEIQWWEKLINSLRAEHTHEIEIFITGSNSSLLSTELSTYLSGRYITIPVHPFSYREFLEIRGLEKNKGSFLEYINFSGIPELYNLPNKHLQENYIRNLKDTIILRDLVKRYNIKEVDLLEKLFLFLCQNIGGLFSIHAIERKLKSQGISISANTLANYLRYLQNILVFHGVDRYDMRGKKILEWEKKYYLNDVGFINFLFSWFESYISRKIENYVMMTLYQNWYTVFTGNIGTKEIDFIAEKNGSKLFIQVAYLLADDTVIEREYGNLRLIKNSFPKYVVTLDDILLPVDETGIEHIQLWNLEEKLQ